LPSAGIVVGGGAAVAFDAATGFASFEPEWTDFPSVWIDSSGLAATSASGAGGRFALAIVGEEPTSEGVKMSTWEKSVPAPKQAKAPAASTTDFTGERRVGSLGRAARGASRVDRGCARAPLSPLSPRADGPANAPS
jgi:hypothetical protein